MRSHSLRRAEPAETFELVARLGYAARGLVYILIGFFAAYGGQADSSRGVLEFISQQAFGGILVGIMALGLFGYGLWRVVGAWYDADGHGSGAKGIVLRIAHGGSGLFHWALAFFAVSLAFGVRYSFTGGGGSGSSGGDGASGAATQALQVPGGQYILMIAGAGFMLAGLFQLLKGYRAKFTKYLSREGQDSALLVWLGRIGYVARGIVFILVGWFAIRAGMAANPSTARGPGEVLDTLVGWPAFALAIGLLIFGIFSLASAYYRRINDQKVRARINGAYARHA